MLNNQASPAELHEEFQRIKGTYKPAKLKKVFRKPVIIVSTPRAGSTLLFETLSASPELWTIGGESHIVYSAFTHLAAENPQFDSGRLDEHHADKETAMLLRAAFLKFLVNTQGKCFLALAKKPAHIRLLEKTPRNALNIPFLNKVFPDAQYIFLHREPRENISSIIDAWERPNFITFPNLPGWARGNWHLLLPPGWRALNGKPVADIAAFQWRESNRIMLDDLKALGSNRWISVNYAGLTGNPAREIARICKFCGIPYDKRLQQKTSSPLPLSQTTVSPPDPDKWRRHEREINRVLPGVEDVANALEELA